MSEQKDDTPTPVTINIDDFAATLRIIDLASKRGAFTPKEFGVIGEVYSRIETFVNAHAKMVKKSEENAAADKGE